MVWICPMCATANQDGDGVCMVCDTAKPAKSVLDAPRKDLLDSILRGARMGELEDRYRRGCALSQEGKYTEAITHLLYAAKGGHAAAQAELGNHYYRGTGVEKSLPVAFGWYTKASDGGDADGMFGLANCYVYAEGAMHNEALGFAYYKKCAGKGHAAGLLGLGNCYYTGLGTPKNESTAFSCFYQAALKGLADAMYMVGYCYEMGIGITKNRESAISWYQKAAEGGDLTAKSALIRMRTDKT